MDAISGGQSDPRQVCASCGSTDNIQVCAGCKWVGYCCKDHQTAHWPTHKAFCKLIPGTKVKKNSEMAPNPLDPSLHYDPRRRGTRREALAGICHFKYKKNGEQKMRLLKPGKLTPYIMNASPREQRRRGFRASDHIETPYEEQGSKAVPLPNGKYRHLASFSLEGLRRLGWDGAMYTALEGRHAATGMFVPFVCCYDSDPDDEYEPFDVQKARNAGIVGLSAEDDGAFFDVPSRGLMKMNNTRQTPPIQH